MGKKALYQKYRSNNFDEVIGQNFVVQAIKNTIKQNKIGHAYLFSGPRGTGKTTMARLLAKAVNCSANNDKPCNNCPDCLLANKGIHPDIIEINAANETSVDHIRDLIEKTYLAPMRGKYKIYIIDEVHQLSSAASSALLKILEEPPENVIFILATTDPQKLLATIISRCQRFEFNYVSTYLIKEHLLNIAKKEEIYLSEEAALAISRMAKGGVRDALSILEQCISYNEGKIDYDLMEKIFGLISTKEKINLLTMIFKKDYVSIINKCKTYTERGTDLEIFLTDLINIVKEIVVYSSSKDKSILEVLTQNEVSEITSYFTNDDWLKILDLMIEFSQKIKLNKNPEIYFEVLCIKISQLSSFKIENTKTNIESKLTITAKTSENIMENKKEEINFAQNIDLTIENIVSILVVCDKEIKNADTQKLKVSEICSTLEDDQITMLLKQLVLVASGKEYMLFTTKSEQLCKRAMDKQWQKKFYVFLKTKLNIDKVPFVITEDYFQKAITTYKERRKDGTLPKPYKINECFVESNTLSKTEEKLFDIFGKENIEMK